MVPDTYHTPVLLQEVLDNLQIQQNEKYIDATLGGGGHTSEILRRGGRVLAIDADADALQFVESRKSEVDKLGRLVVVKGNFRDIDHIARENGFESVAGILFDLGVSSHQLDTPERGFSFGAEGPLDMRMDKELSVTASDLVNGLTRHELAELFTRFGEEGYARQIANKISEERQRNAITTTGQLAAIIESVVKTRKDEHHPATKVFQALRILVNDELHSLEEALPKCLLLLKDKGRLVVISFHSLEDRIVKRAFEKFESDALGRTITDKPVVPSDEEMHANRRSRSSKMRVFERTI